MNSFLEFLETQMLLLDGAIGPDTKLPSLGHIDYDALKASILLKAEELLEDRAEFGLKIMRKNE